MACELPCFSCPFRRDAEPDVQFNWDWSSEYFSDEIKEFICEEQGDICFGQSQLIVNMQRYEMVDPFSDYGEFIEELEPDREMYFRDTYEFVNFHQSDGITYDQDWYWIRFGRGNKTQRPMAVMSETGQLFQDWKNG